MKMKKLFLKIEIFCAHKLLSTNLERFLRRIKSPLMCYKRELYRQLIVQNWSKWLSLNAHNFNKNKH